MSSAALVEGPNGVLAAWETEGQVRFGRVDPATHRIGPVVSAPGPAKGRKHPTLAVNARGETLLAWTEGTGWQRGGSLHWQVFDASGRPTAEKGALDKAIPTWGLATAVANGDGGFAIIY